MLALSVDKQRQIVNCHSFENEHVRSLVASDNYVFLGYQNGSFSRVPKKNFLKRKLNKDATLVVINECTPTSAMVVGHNNLLVSNDKYLYQFSVELGKRNMLEVHKVQPIREMVLSIDQTKLFVSFQCNADIFVYDTETMDQLCQYNCREIVKEILPAADNNDTRVTCMSSVLDVLWIGTGSGHIFIMEYDNERNAMHHLASLQPYALEMRKLCLVELNDLSQRDVKYLMLSSGKSLNEEMFGKNSICNLHADFPLDDAYINRGLSKEFRSPQGIMMNDKHDREGKVILMWQVLDAKGMRNLQSL